MHPSFPQGGNTLLLLPLAPVGDLELLLSVAKKSDSSALNGIDRSPIKASKFYKNGPFNNCLWKLQRSHFAAQVMFLKKEKKKNSLKLIPPQKADMSHITLSQPQKMSHPISLPRKCFPFPVRVCCLASCGSRPDTVER